MTICCQENLSPAAQSIIKISLVFCLKIDKRNPFKNVKKVKTIIFCSLKLSQKSYGILQTEIQFLQFVSIENYND